MTMLIPHRALAADGYHPLPRVYKELTYSEIKSIILKLEEDHPDFVEVFTAQEEYGIDSPGSCGDDGPCVQYIVRIANERLLTPDTPEIFFSGALHGDERIGPNTVTELARLLVEMRTGDGFRMNPWITRLVDTRAIYIMPTTNALGYYQRKRTENNIDPNRDFPYMKPSSQCMQTITARSLNELWRSHLFQLAITYHGGMRAIAYEWGAPNHGKPFDASPDENAQKGIADAMSTYGGSVDGRKIPAGRLNHIVYPVTGGMEDWGYAASWENSKTQHGAGPRGWENGPIGHCDPDNKQSGYHTYPTSRTSSHPSAFRAFNILVETSDSKRPRDNAYGNSAGLLKIDGSGQGHIPRNLRLALLMLDVVQPYVQVMGVKLVDPKADNANGEFIFSLDEVDPDTGDLSGVSNGKMPVLSMKEGEGHLHLDYEVGGGLTVTETDVLWCKYSENIAADDGRKNDGSPTSEIGAEMEDNEFPPNAERIVNFAMDNSALVIHRSPQQKGYTQWHYPDKINRGDMPFRSNFGSTVDVSVDGPGVYFVVVRARLDKDWTDQGTSGTSSLPHPTVGPQSHIVHARNDEDWRVENEGHVIQGRLDWYSSPIKVLVHSSDEKRNILRGSGSQPYAANTNVTNTDKVQNTTSAPGTATAGATVPSSSGTYHIEDPGVKDYEFVGGLFAFVVLVGGAIVYIRRRIAGVQRYTPVMNDPGEMAIEMDGTFVGSGAEGNKSSQGKSIEPKESIVIDC